jgi:hypothetical protein
MDLTLLISPVALAFSCGALVFARNASQSREFSACEITVAVTDVASGTTKTFGLAVSSNHTATRPSWIAKLTKDAVGQMLTLYPAADVHRLVVGQVLQPSCIVG